MVGKCVVNSFGGLGESSCEIFEHHRWQ